MYWYSRWPPRSSSKIVSWWSGGCCAGARPPTTGDPHECHDEHDAGPAVIGADTNILLHAPAKFGHHRDMNVLHFTAEIAVEGGESGRQPGDEPTGQG